MSVAARFSHLPKEVAEKAARSLAIAAEKCGATELLPYLYHEEPENPYAYVSEESEEESDLELYSEDEDEETKCYKEVKWVEENEDECQDNLAVWDEVAQDEWELVEETDSEEEEDEEEDKLSKQVKELRSTGELVWEKADLTEIGRCDRCGAGQDCEYPVCQICGAQLVEKIEEKDVDGFTEADRQQVRIELPTNWGVSYRLPVSKDAKWCLGGEKLVIGENGEMELR